MFNSIEFEEGVRAIYVICLEKDYATNKNKNRSRRVFLTTMVVLVVKFILNNRCHLLL